MALRATVVSIDAMNELKWVQALKTVCDGLPGAGIMLGMSVQEKPEAYGQIVFVDGTMPAVEDALKRIPRGGRAVFLVSSDSPSAMKHCMTLITAGAADDAIVYPFRLLEVQSRLRHFQQILLWEEVTKLNASFSGVIDRLKDDLELATRVQKSKVPVRFPEIKGFEVKSRYLAGMKSGGDHLDLAESANGNQLAIVLADCSSYGLSSALLSVLVRVAAKLGLEDSRSSEETVRRIYDELLLTLGEKDELSIFYGVISRKDYVLRYVNLGTSTAYYAAPKGEFSALPARAAAITKPASLPSGTFGGEIALEPGSRLVLLSDGFLNGAVASTLNQFRKRDLTDTLNELVFSVKSRFGEDAVPEQDCTAIAFDLSEKILRVTK